MVNRGLGEVDAIKHPRHVSISRLNGEELAFSPVL